MKKYLLILPVLALALSFGAYKAYADIYGSSLIAWWTMDSNAVSGTSLIDKSGNSNTGTINNGPTAMAGKTGQALLFNGVNQNVDIPTFSANSWTVNIWAKYYGTVYGNYTFLSFDNYPATPRDCILIKAAAANAYQYAFCVNNTVQFSSPAITGLNIANWNMITLVFDDTTGNGYVYINGKYQLGYVLTGGGPYSYIDGRLANHYYSSTEYEYSNVALDDVRIYNRLLTTPEVQQLYYQTQGTHGGFN